MRVRACVRVLYTYVTKYVSGNIGKDVGKNVCVCVWGLKFNLLLQTASVKRIPIPSCL